MLHLLYARFFTKVLHDVGLVSVREPFARLFTQGMIYRDGAKMSKSKGNVVAPDEIVNRYGADTLRLYVLFMGPAADDIEWSDRGVEGQRRFIDRLWRLVGGLPPGELAARPTRESLDGEPAALELVRKAEATIAKVSDDISERFSFHTAISAVQELVNLATKGVARGPVRERARGGRPALRRPDGRVAAVPVRARTSPASCGRRSAARRCGASPGPRPTRPSWSARPSRSWCRSTASCATASRWPWARPTPTWWPPRARCRKVAAVIEGKTVVREVVVPGRLVNLVVK